MPYYRITIRTNIGADKVGLRWHTSDDTDYVRRIVEEKVKKALGTAAVKWTDVELVSHSAGNKIERKSL